MPSTVAWRQSIAPRGKVVLAQKPQVHATNRLTDECVGRHMQASCLL